MTFLPLGPSLFIYLDSGCVLGLGDVFDFLHGVEGFLRLAKCLAVELGEFRHGYACGHCGDSSAQAISSAWLITS